MEGPPLGPRGEDITWPDRMAPRGRPASSTRKIKPQTSNLLQVFLASADIPLHVPSGDLISESTVSPTSHWDWLLGWCGAPGTYRCLRWSTAVVVLRTEPLVTPILTATAGRHTLVKRRRRPSGAW